MKHVLYKYSYLTSNYRNSCCPFDLINPQNQNSLSLSQGERACPRTVWNLMYTLQLWRNQASRTCSKGFPQKKRKNNKDVISEFISLCIVINVFKYSFVRNILEISLKSITIGNSLCKFTNQVDIYEYLFFKSIDSQGATIQWGSTFHIMIYMRL